MGRDFSRSLGSINSFTAELWGLREGLMLYNSLELTIVDIHLDVIAIVQLLSKPSDANLAVMPVLEDCRWLISHIGQVRIGHCYREANSCVDCLARIGTAQENNFILYHDSPMDLLELLSSDNVGMKLRLEVKGAEV
ncbi:uncharacterized protein LOC142643165 [Castanea sativa]|uniref:uncharacterized protein LOC142643165 n=1 Tax=Castanea sativa TaxID=21020 RepID=UPI003F6493DE